MGVSVPNIRALAKRIGKDDALAEAIWNAGIHEARQLAPLIANAATVSEATLERWVCEIDSWDICDGLADFVAASPFGWTKVREWARRAEEFVRRAGFVVLACLAVHDKAATDEQFMAFFPDIRAASTDQRNFVKKAVNWALRGIGKRNVTLNAAAIACGEQLRRDGSQPARWIAADALRELRSEAVQARLERR